MKYKTVSVTELELPAGVEAGNVSDGFHTFNELYAHRVSLFMLILMMNKDKAFKTYKNKEGEEWKGWCIVGLDTKYGQITYHIPDKHYDSLKGITEKERNHDYDGHDADEVQKRLDKLILDL